MRLDLYRLTCRDEKICQLAGTLMPVIGGQAEQLGLGLRANSIRNIYFHPDFHFRAKNLVAASLREAINARR